MKFVVGKEGSFVVQDRAFVMREHATSSGRKIPASIGVRHGGQTFAIKRGAAEEYRDRWSDGGHVYARILPEDAEPDLAVLDEQIVAAEFELKRLRAERQAFLAAHVVRGKPITVKAIEALPAPPLDLEKAKRLREDTAKMQNFVDHLFGQK